MDNTRKRRPKSPALPPSPGGLVRTKSRSSAISLPENNSCAANTSQRSSIVRSKSRSSTKSKDEENLNPSICKTKPGLAKFSKSTPATSPSAWALSPGRSLGSPVVATLQSVADGGRGKSSGRRSGGGAISGVLRFFRPKKAAAEAEEVHRLRIMQNRLLQWKYVNGRAQTSMANVTTLTQERIFSVWLHNMRMRNGILEKRIEVKKLENEIKLYRIIFPQVCLLKQYWAKLEKRNQESVATLASVLSTFSLRLPLIHGAQAELNDFQQALNTAMEVMAKLETMITKTTYQLEKTLYILTERLSIYKEQEDSLEKLEEAVRSVTKLLAKESSVRIQLMQANKC